MNVINTCLKMRYDKNMCKLCHPRKHTNPLLIHVLTVIMLLHKNVYLLHLSISFKFNLYFIAHYFRKKLWGTNWTKILGNGKKYEA